MKPKMLLFGLFIIVMLCALTFVPVGQPNDSNVEKISGIVKDLGPAGPADIAFKIKDDHNYYYINRGEEFGLVRSELTAKLKDQQVDIYYIKHWSLLNPNNSHRHIAKVVFGDEVIYSEMN